MFDANFPFPHRMGARDVPAGWELWFVLILY